MEYKITAQMMIKFLKFARPYEEPKQFLVAAYRSRFNDNGMVALTPVQDNMDRLRAECLNSGYKPIATANTGELLVSSDDKEDYVTISSISKGLGIGLEKITNDNHLISVDSLIAILEAVPVKTKLRKGHFTIQRDGNSTIFLAGEERGDLKLVQKAYYPSVDDAIDGGEIQKRFIEDNTTLLGVAFPEKLKYGFSLEDLADALIITRD